MLAVAILPEVRPEVFGIKFLCLNDIQVGVMVTASRDQLIKLWRSGVSTHTLVGHSAGVTSLAVVSSSEFLSGSEDASIRKWSKDGDIMGKYSGGDSPISSISFLKGGGWLTSGGDSFLHVWFNNTLAQTISVSANHLIGSTALPTGDFAAISDDGRIWMFTQNTSEHSKDALDVLGQRVTSALYE